MRELYKVYLKSKDQSYKWKTSALETFDEVLYQITRVYDDPSPEENVFDNYLNDAKNNIGTRYGSDFVFCIVWAILKLVDNRPDNVEFFLVSLEPKISHSLYFSDLADFVKDMECKGIKCEWDFNPNPVCLSKLNLVKDWMNWEAITNGYDETLIRKYVNRYQAKQDKLALLRMIEEEYDLYQTTKTFNIDNLPF